jgi:hypothetical protein
LLGLWQSVHQADIPQRIDSEEILMRNTSDSLLACDTMLDKNQSTGIIFLFSERN